MGPSRGIKDSIWQAVETIAKKIEDSHILRIIYV